MLVGAELLAIVQYLTVTLSILQEGMFPHRREYSHFEHHMVILCCVPQSCSLCVSLLSCSSSLLFPCPYQQTFSKWQGYLPVPS